MIAASQPATAIERITARGFKPKDEHVQQTSTTLQMHRQKEQKKLLLLLNRL
jgi:hypothetical protein